MYTARTLILGILAGAAWTEEATTGIPSIEEMGFTDAPTSPFPVSKRLHTHPGWPSLSPR